MSGSLWISFAFFTASVFATLSLLDKILLDQGAYGPITTTALSGVPMLSGFICLGIVTGDTRLSSLSSPTVLFVAGVGIVGGCVYVVSLWTYFLGLEQTDVSRFVPILSLDTIFVLALGFVVFNERFHPTVYGGVVLVVLGTGLISLQDLTTGVAFSSRRAVWWGLVVSGTNAVFSVVLKYMTEFLTLFGVLFWIGVGGHLSILGLVVWQYSRSERTLTVSGVRSIVSVPAAALSVRGVILAVGFVSFTLALQTGPVSIVVTLLNLDVFLVFFATVVLTRVAPEVLHERITRPILVQKFVASVLIVAGVVIIQTVTG